MAPGPYRLVTFGQSFYWTDEVRVAEAVYDMVEPGGALGERGPPRTGWKAAPALRPAGAP